MLLVALAAGCGAAETDGLPPTAPTLVKVAPTSFALALDDEHPWRDEARPIDCAAGADASDTSLQIETGVCLHGVWVTTAPTTLPPSALTFTFWHSLLTVGADVDADAPAPAAHLAVAIDDVVIVDRHVSIPTPDGDEAVAVDVGAIEAGALISLHLHNHGSNHWGIAPLIFQPGDAL